MNPLLVLLRKLLGLGARKAAETALDKLGEAVNAPPVIAPKPHARHTVQARPIGEPTRRAQDVLERARGVRLRPPPDSGVTVQYDPPGDEHDTPVDNPQSKRPRP